jgi:transglutaminase-like putative cysteine protease
MIYRISHRTFYRYAEAASLCHNEARLRPLDTPSQRRISWKLRIDPEPDYLRGREDSFGNHVDYFAIQRPHKELSIIAESEVEVSRSPSLDLGADIAWDAVGDHLRAHKDPAFLEARTYMLSSPQVPITEELRSFAKADFEAGRPVLEAVSALNTRIFKDFKFTPGFTTVSTPVAEVLKNRCGVCQDFAQLMIGALRSMGVPARYVSGYLETLPPPGKPKLIGADASHAWVSIYVPELGWVDFDPTNNIRASERHIVTAVGRDYGDVAPLRGVTVGGAHHQLSVAVDVNPVAIAQK